MINSLPFEVAIHYLVQTTTIHDITSSYGIVRFGRVAAKRRSSENVSEL